MPRRSFLERLRDYLFPHVGNSYKPLIFGGASVIAIIFIVVIAQGAFLGLTRFVYFNTNFLSSVLPGVLISLTNSDRTQNGVGQVTDNAVLTEAAQEKANDMAAKGYFSHVSPDGKTPWYWLSQAGYKYSYAGENLAVDFTDSEAVENAWMNSPTHRANIVKPQYTEVGIATAQGTYEGQPATFVVQFFASPAASTPPPVPVASEPVSAPVETPAPATPPSVAVSSASAPASAPEVLGTTSLPSQPPSAGNASGIAAFFGTLATSPDHALVYFLAALMLVVGGLLALAVFVEVRVQYLGVIAGGLLVLAVAGASLYVDSSKLAKVTLPSDSQASVYVGLQGAQ